MRLWRPGAHVFWVPGAWLLQHAQSTGGRCNLPFALMDRAANIAFLYCKFTHCQRFRAMHVAMILCLMAN